MTDPDRRQSSQPDDMGDDRSDIEQAVAARSDAVERGEGGSGFDGLGGESGAGGVVKNQEGNDQ